jgi:outer membrane protein
LSYYDRVDPERLSPGGAAGNQRLFAREGLTSLTGKQILFDGFKTYYNTKAAVLGEKAQQQEVARTEDDVAYQVTDAFYRLLEAKETEQVARTALQERQKFLEITEAFFRAGKVTRVDALKAKTQALEAEQGLVEAVQAQKLAKEILARTVGLEEKSHIDIRGQLPRQFTSAGDFESLWSRLKEANPELKALKLELVQSEALIKAARGGYMPEVSLQGAAGVRHRDVGGTKSEYLGGIFMEFPFFEGGLTRAQVSKAASQYRQLLEKQRDRVDALRVELMNGWKEVENACQGVRTSRQNVAASEEAYQSALALYRVGKATGLDVLTAELELTRARLSLIHYQVLYEIGRSKIKQLLGEINSPQTMTSPRRGVGQ